MFEFVTGSFGFVPSLTTIFIGIFTLFLLYWYSTRNHGYFKDKGIPCAKTYPFLGSIRETLKNLEKSEIQRHKTLGPIYGHFEANRPLLSVADPALIKDILIKDFHIFPARRDFQFGDEVMDSILSFTRGENWKRIRTIVTPTFTTGKIKRMVGIFKDCAETLAKNLAETKGEDVEVKRIISAFTMDIIASSAFSTKIDSHNNPDNLFVSKAKKFFVKDITWRGLFFLFAPKLMKLLRISLFDPEIIDFFVGATKEIIEERKRTGQTRNDFLQLLLDTAENEAKEPKSDIPETKKDLEMLNNYGEEPNTDHKIFRNALSVKKTLSINELVAQCVIFFIAGHDTTASPLTYCIYQLALNQHVQDRAREEVDSIINDFKGDITYEGLQQMKYLDNVISEGLRMLTPAARAERMAETDYKLGDTGITVPKGMIVTIPIYALHHDPENFPDPKKFDPDRFLPEEKAKRNQFVYLPFGAGPRNCVAMRFALMEMKVCLAHILATFKIMRSPNTKDKLKLFDGAQLLDSKQVILRMEKREDTPLAKK